jgi:glycosyltransferase involved in cell wall biosynthesis
MRIAQVIPAGAQPYSGVPTVIVQLAVHLARLGHHIEAWLMYPWTDEEVAIHGSMLAEADVPMVMASRCRRARMAPLVAREVDIVHLHSVFTLANARLARRLRVPYVVSPHGGYGAAPLGRSSMRKSLYIPLVERRLVRGAALRVALTEFEARDLRTFGSGEPIAVIPNGVHPAPRVVDPDAFRRELGLDANCRLLLFVGRFDVIHKGLDTLVRGVAATPGWHLVLVGSDFRGGGDQLRRLATTLGAGSSVTLTGPRHGQALYEAYAAADCFALTSRWEGLPLSLLEALAHGLPAVVSPAVDQLVGVVAAGAGWSAAPADLGALLQRLQDLDSRELKRREAAARALAAGYDWTSIARRYEDAYTGVLATAPYR